MASKSLKHKFVSAYSDYSDTSLVKPSQWNDEHNLWLGGRSVTAGTDTLADSDHLSLVKYNNATGVAVALPQAGAGGQFISGWTGFVRNLGAGTVTITPTSSTINQGASIPLTQNQGAIIFSDGSNYDAIICGAAPLLSPAFTGTPTAPTPATSPSDNSTALATTAFVVNEVSTPHCGRMIIASGTQITFNPTNGNKLKVNGKLYDIPPPGPLVGAPSGSNCWLNGVQGSTLANSTFYYVYVFDNAGALQIDFSATGHATSITAGNVGTEIKSGDNTRSLIGAVYVNASGQFTDNPTTRLVLSWFNRRWISLQGAGTAGAGTTSTTLVAIAGAAWVNFISWADEAIVATVSGTVLNTSANGNNLTNFGLDNATGLSVYNANCQLPTANMQGPASVSAAFYASEGALHYLEPLAAVGTGTGAWYVSISGSMRG